MAELKDKKCIVCGAWVAWEGRLPCACAEHRYHEVFEAYDKARLTKRAADKSQPSPLKVKLRVALAANANR